jgi:hypothetical protein
VGIPIVMPHQSRGTNTLGFGLRDKGFRVRFTLRNLSKFLNIICSVNPFVDIQLTPEWIKFNLSE